MNEEIAAALIVFREECGSVALDKVNPHFGSKFASLTGILKTIKPALDKAGLVILQFPISRIDDGRISIGCLTVVQHSSGQTISGEFVFPLMKQDPAAGMAALTWARRAALGSVLGLVIEEGDEAGISAAVANAGKKSPRKRTSPAMSAEFRDKLKRAADLRIKLLGDSSITQNEVLISVAKALSYASPIEMKNQDYERALTILQKWEPGE